MPSGNLEAALRISLTGSLRTHARELLEAFGTFEKALGADFALWEQAGIDKPVLYAKARSDGMGRKASQAAAEARANGVQMVSLEDPDFPPLLKVIHDPPPLLFIKGDPAALQHPSIAVVGARRASEGSLAFANSVAFDLARAGATIVSGLAVGVDAQAHRATVAAGGRGA